MVSKSGCVGWLKKRTNLEKTLLSLSSMLMLTLLLMILISVAFHGKKSDGLSEDDEVCSSSDCIKAAGDVLSSMDRSADKCTNFYSFACGKYGQEPGQTVSVPKRAKESAYFSLKRIMETEDVSNIDSLKEVKNFYNSCVKFGSYRQDVGATRESLLSLMTEMVIGIWPIIDTLYDAVNFSLADTLVNLILLDIPVVYRMDIVPDDRLDGSYLLKISPGGPRESGRSPSDIRSDVLLRSSVLTSFLLVGSSASIVNVNDILTIDSTFAAIEQEKGTPCDDVTMLTPQEAIPELNRLMPEIDWNVTITKFRRATGLLLPFAVELHCKGKIRDYVLHLDDLAIRSVSNYLGWRFFSKFVDHVIPTFETSQFGTDDVVPRWRVCLELMERFASPVLASALTHSLIDKEIQEIERISNAALTATQRLVSRARWLNDSAKPGILEKVSRIRIRYPFQDRALRPERVSVPQVEVSNFTAVVIQSQRQWMIQKFKQLSQDESSGVAKTRIPVLSERRSGSFPDYDAFVYIDKIRNPYMRFHGSKWMNYGGFGVSVAREISNLLMSMNSGRSQAESSELWNLWSRSRNSSMCLERSYTALLKMKDEAVPPQVTEKLMRDIFLEQSALEIAYETATAIAASSKSHSLPGLGLRNEELFFLSYAQTLCDAEPSSAVLENIPVKDRLNKAVSSFKTFNEIFSCVSPSTRCQIWA